MNNIISHLSSAGTKYEVSKGVQTLSNCRDMQVIASLAFGLSFASSPRRAQDKKSINNCSGYASGRVG